MNLKNLEISGFKSFRDRVVLDFSNGVTGIVGPNGCGKSNIVDAIRWVMGEQRVKALRGKKWMMWSSTAARIRHRSAWLK